MSKLQDTLTALQKTYGKGSVDRTENLADNEVKTFSTQSITLDLALGGGLAVGRIIEIYGPESSGKTTLTLHAIAQIQKKGGEVAFIDAEHAFDPLYAEALGINVDKMIFCQPDYGEQGMEIAQKLAESGDVRLIVIDSVSAMLPKKVIEGDHGDSNIGLQARMMSQGVAKLIGAAKRNDCTIIFINQLREKIGVMFGSPEVTSGGNALKFYASQRIDIRRSGFVKEKNEKGEEEIIANEIKIKVIKNKIAPPFKVAMTQIVYGKGFNVMAEILSLGIELGIIKKGGSWYSYEETKLGQGEKNVWKVMEDNPDMVNQIRRKINMQLKVK